MNILQSAYKFWKDRLKDDGVELLPYLLAVARRIVHDEFRLAAYDRLAELDQKSIQEGRFSEDC